MHEISKMVAKRKELGLSTDGKDPLFMLSNGKIATRKDAIDVLNTLTTTMGLDSSKYSGHSFRRGGAQSLKNAGAEDWIIQILGRWSSDAYKEYYSLKPSQLANFLFKMMKSVRIG